MTDKKIQERANKMYWKAKKASHTDRAVALMKWVRNEMMKEYGIELREDEAE